MTVCAQAARLPALATDSGCVQSAAMQRTLFLRPENRMRERRRISPALGAATTAPARTASSISAGLAMVAARLSLITHGVQKLSLAGGPFARCG